MKIDKEASKKFGHKVYRAEPKAAEKTEPKKTQKKSSRDEEDSEPKETDSVLRDE